MPDTHKEEMKKSQAKHRKRVKNAQLDRGFVIVNTGDGKVMIWRSYTS